jgi:hypothetical protein
MMIEIIRKGPAPTILPTSMKKESCPGKI